jgi:hypothetical protein
MRRNKHTLKQMERLWKGEQVRVTELANRLRRLSKAYIALKIENKELKSYIRVMEQEGISDDVDIQELFF